MSESTKRLAAPAWLMTCFNSSALALLDIWWLNSPRSSNKQMFSKPCEGPALSKASHVALDPASWAWEPTDPDSATSCKMLLLYSASLAFASPFGNSETFATTYANVCVHEHVRVRCVTRPHDTCPAVCACVRACVRAHIIPQPQEQTAGCEQS